MRNALTVFGEGLLVGVVVVAFIFVLWAVS